VVSADSYGGAAHLSSFDAQWCVVKRKYELKRRAERRDETRRRIVEAAVGLHTTLGPAQTSISAIAERAGVQRQTVYAHFPDAGSMLAACSAHWDQLHPLPRRELWLGETDPRARLRRALDALYAWYESVEDHLVLFARDANAAPENRELAERRAAARRELADTLLRDLPRRKAVRAAVGHALEFETWRSLVRRQGLSRRGAVDAMLALVDSV
jgi:AcrR family transcriptional regulator